MRALSYLPIAFFLCCVAVAGFLLIPQTPLTTAALDVCFETGIPDSACLDREVPSLLTRFSTRELMAHVIASSTPYTVTSYCHEAAHVIGKETYKRSANNVESALSMCSHVCNFGCVHGVIAAAVAHDLGEESLSEDMVHAEPAEIERIGSRYCEKGLCHAVGHILYIGTHAITPALESCDRMNASNSAESCYQGVFMEAAGGEAVFVASTSSRIDSNYAYPCDSVNARYQHACFQYLTNFQRQLFHRDNVPETDQFMRARSACETFTGKPRSDCFFGIGYIFLRTNQLKDTANDPRRPALCETLQGTDQDSCVVGLALKNALSDKYVNGLTYCAHRSDARRIALCYNAVFQTMHNAELTDDAVYARCDATTVTDICRSQYERYQSIETTLPQYYKEGLL